MVFQKSTPQKWMKSVKSIIFEGSHFLLLVNSHFFFHGEVPHFSRDRFFQEHKSLAEQADAAASAARGTAKALGLPAHEQATERPTGADRGAEETIFLKHPMVDRFHEIININYLMVPRGFNDITGGSIPIKSHMMVTI